MKRKYSEKEIHHFVESAKSDGFVILRNHLNPEKIRQWRETSQPLLDRQIKLEGNETSRGSNRYYVSFPFEMPFADPEFYEDGDILAIVEGLVGKRFVMCQLASDTPLKGSVYQDIHRDCPPLFPEEGIETPMFQLAVNFPLVDVTPENGPLEIIRGTHMLSRDQGLDLVESNKAKIEQLEMKAGDVLIRDVRTLHRGTPNHTDVPRPMVVLGYSRSWLHRPEVSINIPREEYEKLSPNAKAMLRFNPIVDEIDRELKPESYTVFQY
ncbi:MAG: phytanoyl-CoA dioxygenase family protein [Bacteriovoracaceae bacterium]